MRRARTKLLLGAGSGSVCDMMVFEVRVMAKLVGSFGFVLAAVQAMVEYLYCCGRWNTEDLVLADVAATIEVKQERVVWESGSVSACSFAVGSFVDFEIQCLDHKRSG